MSEPPKWGETFHAFEQLFHRPGPHVFLLRPSELDVSTERGEKEIAKETYIQYKDKKTHQLSIPYQKTLLTTLYSFAYLCLGGRFSGVEEKKSFMHFYASLIVYLVGVLQQTASNQPNIATPPPAGSTAVRWADE